jgi:TetR/AcrR family transcriptional repressor of acrEF/envCD operon
MTSECEIRQRIGFNYENVRVLLEKGMANGIISPLINIDMTLIVFHGFFSGLIKNWLMNSENFNLYQQAPALVDNILATLNMTRTLPENYSVAS